MELSRCWAGSLSSAKALHVLQALTAVYISLHSLCCASSCYMDCCKRGNTRYAAVYWQLGMLDKTLVYQQEVTLDQHRPSSRYKRKGRERDKGWVQGWTQMMHPGIICVLGEQEQEHEEIRDQGMEGEGLENMNVEPEGQRP